jgi:hypothetical protein
MEIDWVPPSLSNAPKDFYQWGKRADGEGKGAYTAIWITNTDAMRYFSLSDDILEVMKVPTVPTYNSSQPDIPRYALYHIWDLAKLYMTEGEADAAWRKFLNDRLRGIGPGNSPGKGRVPRFN